MSCWQAVHARHLKSEFSEATYIGLTVASLCQGFLTGIPVVVVVRDMPRAYYVVLSLTIFLLSMAVLGLIFVPKMLMAEKYKGKSKEEQAHMIRQGVLRNSPNNSESTPMGGGGGGGVGGQYFSTSDYSGRQSGAGGSSSGYPMSSSNYGYRSEFRRYPSSEGSDETDLSGNFAYRSDHARGNDLTTTSIPEEQILEEEEEEEEEDKDEETASGVEQESKQNNEASAFGNTTIDSRPATTTTTTTTASEEQRSQHEME